MQAMKDLPCHLQLGRMEQQILQLATDSNKPPKSEATSLHDRSLDGRRFFFYHLA